MGCPHHQPTTSGATVLDNVSPGMPRRAVQSRISTLLSDVEVRVRWPRLIALHEDIKIMLANRMGQAGRNGRPAYLACATLAALLKVDTKHVVELLANYRRALTSAGAVLPTNRTRPQDLPRALYSARL